MIMIMNYPLLLFIYIYFFISITFITSYLDPDLYKMKSIN